MIVGDHQKRGRARAALLEQEVERLLPEAVKRDPDGFLAVSYSSVVPVLVEALAEQREHSERRFADQAEALASLRAELTTLTELLPAVFDAQAASVRQR